MANLTGDSADATLPGVKGENTAGDGVTGTSNTGYGVHGTSQTGYGVLGESQGSGVVGKSTGWFGVVGLSDTGSGVYGEATGSGVIGKSKTWHGTAGFSESTTGGAGLYGEATGPGVIGKSKTWHGIYGETTSTTGGAGVWGEHKGDGSGVVGISQSGAGVYGKGGRVAGFFEGRVEVKGDLDVTGDIRLANADCAEDFDIADASSVEPGTVMVLGEDALHASQQPYDKRVAGVISGAGAYKPGIVLDQQPARTNRKPLALMGKVYCKVDAGYASIEVGDLLTTSATPGHAMKASEPLKAFGAVLGKALRPLKEGQGLIPVLIALQ
ncbi:hypothetical protein [Hymenobacter sp. GOD-10R]|uniref:hypothetical protein n=1 Tax=Hymenobacter sp. GOD-10R TaxID=3093922 RepID=UPI002D78E275|nr:hypothetical protein [Hymenobacter sp. GOD-10R]WRQ30380.1 hypothetical protein SD425_08915 [Hymenobacter sp. GOD-10R]